MRNLNLPQSEELYLEIKKVPYEILFFLDSNLVLNRESKG